MVVLSVTHLQCDWKKAKNFISYENQWQVKIVLDSVHSFKLIRKIGGSQSGINLFCYDLDNLVKVEVIQFVMVTQVNDFIRFL